MSVYDLYRDSLLDSGVDPNEGMEPDNGPLRCEYCGAFISPKNEGTYSRTYGYPGEEWTEIAHGIECRKCRELNFVWTEDAARAAKALKEEPCNQ